MAKILNKPLAEALFATSLVLLAFPLFKLYKPNYQIVYCMANVKHI